MIAKEISNVRDDFAVSVKEGKLLYRLAKQCSGRGVIVELGSWKGYSTIWLAKGSLARGSVAASPVYAVDTYAGFAGNHNDKNSTYASFVTNIMNAGVDSKVIPLVMSSEAAERIWGDIPIELLWIDGDHDDIEADFAIWCPHLVIGGTIALHDTVAWPSMLPYKVTVKELYKSGRFTDVKRVGCLTYARKAGRASGTERLRNYFALWRRYVYQMLIPYYTKVLVFGDKCLRRIGCR